MATIKAYTDIEQSKKLAEILPIKSADMGWNLFADTTTRVLPIDDWALVKNGSDKVKFYPAWTLAALLDILPVSIYDNTDEYSQLEFSKISVAYHDINDRIKVGSIKDNLVDACYELILKLHEFNLL